jgi:putative transposase
MPKPYSEDLRIRMIKAVEAGHSRHEVARRFGVSPSCVVKLLHQWKTIGDCSPQNFGGHKKHALTGYEAEVRALVAAQPDLTVTELWQKVQKLGVKVGRSAVGRFLLHLDLTYKKNSLRHRTAASGRSGRPHRLAGATKRT